MSKSKEEKTQQKIEKQLAKANKALSKKQAAYEKALEDGDEKKIAKAEKNLNKALEKYENKIEKIEEKYGVSINNESFQPVETKPQYAPGTTDVYGNPLQTTPQETVSAKETPAPQEETQQTQMQSTGDPFIDLIMHVFELTLEMKRQRFEEEMALRERILGLNKSNEYTPLYNENAQTSTYNENTQTQTVPPDFTQQSTTTNPPTNKVPEMTPEQIARMLQMQKQGRI